MKQWLAFTNDYKRQFGLLDEGGELIQIYSGSPFDSPQAVVGSIEVKAVTIDVPCQPGKFIGLWNNFYSRADHEGWDIPPEPLYFHKLDTSWLSHGQDIVRPKEYQGPIFFEAELGIVIGKACYGIAESDADDHIFGYTCVNDVTAREVLHRDPSFPQWTRAKGYDTFGVFGPVITTDIDPDELVIQGILDGEVKQQYPVSDMVFQPRRLVSVLSHYMTLMPGDVIACGTGLGACEMKHGQSIEINIDGVGKLSNTMRG